MSAEMWTAILNPRGPNYERLKDVLPLNVPLKSPHSACAQLGPEKDVEVYMLDLGALPLNRRSRLLTIVAQKSGVTVDVVEKIAATEGFPIRAADVIVSFSTRAFM